MENIVVELSGKSSVVALLDFVDNARKEDKKYRMTFSIAYVPSEYEDDPTSNIFTLGEILKMHVQRYGNVVDEMLFSAEGGSWFRMVKPFLSKKPYTPCVACKAYCHLCRLEIAKNAHANILTGERESQFHTGCKKISQFPEVLQAFDKYFDKYNIKFIREVYSKSDQYINTRYEEFCNEYGIDLNKYTFPKCHLEDNIEVNDNNLQGILSNVLDYLDDLSNHMDYMYDYYSKAVENLEMEDE